MIIHQNGAIYSLISVIIIAYIAFISYQKALKKRDIREILKDNNLYKETTRINYSKKRIVITNYKKIETENLEKITKILADETGDSYLLKRSSNRITLEKFKQIPKKMGIYSQNTETGILDTFAISKLKNWNGIFVAGESGTGKSELVKALTRGKETIIFSPKGNKDFETGKPFNSEMIEEIQTVIKQYKTLEKETIIIIDEIITFIALVKKINKELLEQMSVNFTLNRDSNLKWILITQKLNKESLLDIGLLNYKIINHREIANFKQTLGITYIRTNIQRLQVGQFLLFDENGEHLIQNNIKS